jgi:hypothetical protein
LIYLFIYLSVTCAGIFTHMDSAEGKQKLRESSHSRPGDVASEHRKQIQ